MSEENVERARGFYRHFNEFGEPPWEQIAPDADFDASAIVGFGVLRGRDAVRSALRDYAAAWEDWTMTPEEILDAGDRVLVTVRDGGRLRGTGDEFFNLFFHLLTFKSGKVVHWKTFIDRGKALEAAGLQSQ